MATPVTQVADPVYSELAEHDKDFADIVQLFVDGLLSRLESMQEALTSNDLQSLRRLAHQLKGSGGGHGYPSLTDTASKLEQQAIEGQADEIKTALVDLSNLIARVKVLP